LTAAVPDQIIIDRSLGSTVVMQNMVQNIIVVLDFFLKDYCLESLSFTLLRHDHPSK